MAKPKADRKAKGGKPKAAPKPRAKKVKAESTGAQKAEKRDAKGQFTDGNPGGPGRNTIYTAEIGQKIAEFLAQGMTVNDIDRMEGFPAGSTIRLWALNAEHPFYALYTRGREIGYHKMADDCQDIIDDGRNDWMARQMAGAAEDDPARVAYQLNGEHVNRSRLRFEGRKWLLAKALPKIYGDKVALTDADGGKLVIEFAA